MPAKSDKTRHFCLKMRHFRVGTPIAYRRVPATRRGLRKFKMTQVQITKTPAAKTPRANKAKAKTEAKTTQAAALQITHAISDYARPKAGAALFAHTHAFLVLSGIQAGGAYPKAKAVQVVGPTAVKYHTQNGNLEATAEGLKLTPKGQAAFSVRPIDPEYLAAYTEVFTTGKTNDKANAKTAASIVALK